MIEAIAVIDRLNSLLDMQGKVLQQIAETLTPTPEDTWVNATEAALEMKCTNYTVAMLADQGAIKSKVIGKRVHFLLSDCKKYKKK